MSQITDLPSEAKALSLLHIVFPDSKLVAIRSIADDHHNETYIVEGQLSNGEPLPIVVKRYVNNHHVEPRARLEFNILQWLYRNGVPAPEPLYLDDTGKHLGTPGLIMHFVPGHRIMLPSDHPLDSQAWAQEMAHSLAGIHSTPLHRAAQALLVEGAFEGGDVLWFMKPGSMPDYLKNHALGEVVWNTICESLPHLQQVPSTLTHTDYWPGNILWHDNKIVAVIDWEEAAYYNPNSDVAYCRMDMFLTGHQAVADEFLQVYETTMGRPVADLGFWQLAAAVRPMFHPEGWITGSPAQERFQHFVQDSLDR